MGYNNLFLHSSLSKEMFCEELKMPMNTLNKQIDNLRKANILLQFQIKRLLFSGP